MLPGGVGLVKASMRMPRRSGKAAVGLSPAMFVVRDGEAWTWTQLQFTP